MSWKMTYRLNSDTYHPLSKGSMSSAITNNTKQKMLVTEVGLNFDWMGAQYWYKDCNIEIAPNDKVDLPPVPFTIQLQASTGTHLYKPGVVCKLLTESGWELQNGGIAYVGHGRHIMVTEASTRNFEVFISHSNSKKDNPLLDKTIESFSKCGIKTYIAERSPQPGYPLWQKIEAAIRRADAILILWTENGSQSGDIREEIGIAIGARKSGRIIPLVQTDLATRGLLTGLEHVPLDTNNPLEALSTAVSKAIEWADKKEQEKPKIAPVPWTPSKSSWVIPPKPSL